MSFSRVLVLMPWFTLPITDEKGTKNVLDPCNDLHLRVIGNEPRGGTAIPYDVLKGVGKLFLSFHTDNVNDLGVKTNEDLKTSFTTINGRGIYKTSVGGKGFIALKDIGPWKWRFELLLQDLLVGRQSSILCCVVKCVANDIRT